MSDYLRRRACIVGAVVVASGVAALVAAACIPDLPASTATDAGGPEAPQPGGGYCGDGFIDLVAGEQCDPGGQPSATCDKKCHMVCTAGLPDGGASAMYAKNNHCYFEPVGKTNLHVNAISACTSTSGLDPQDPIAHLVTISSDDEWQFVASSFGSSAPTTPIWIGMSRGSDPGFNAALLEEPGWTPTTGQVDCAGCFVHAVDASVELPRQPLPDGAIPPANNCVVGYPGAATWLEQGCDNGSRVSARVICEREPAGQLIATCNGVLCFRLQFTSQEKAYYFVPSAVAEDEAATECAQLGGRLVVFKTREEREQLWHELLKIYPVPPVVIWIGLSQVSPDGGATLWQWEDGTAADMPDAYPPPWGSQQPDADTPRAISYTLTQSPRFDNELARADPSVLTAQFVCEVAPDAGP